MNVSQAKIGHLKGNSSTISEHKMLMELDGKKESHQNSQRGVLSYSKYLVADWELHGHSTQFFKRQQE